MEILLIDFDLNHQTPEPKPDRANNWSEVGNYK